MNNSTLKTIKPLSMDQDLNQKIKIGTVRSQLGKRALAHPNLAEGGGGEGGSQPSGVVTRPRPLEKI